MTIKRKETRNIVVIMSGTPKSSSEYDLRAAYLSRHVPSIGSHYVVLEDGDVIKARDVETYGNVEEQWNKQSVFIEVMGMDPYDLTEAQRASLRGLVDRLEETYLDAETLYTF